MKKSLALLLVLMLAFSLVAVGCGGTEDVDNADSADDTNNDENIDNNDNNAEDEDTGNEDVNVEELEDGIYFATQDEFHNGWKYVATLEVKDGKIVSADWEGVSENAGKTKSQASEDGEYGMVENGGAIAPWYEQAEVAAKYLVDNQNFDAIEFDAEGHTDAISGATIGVKEFADLANKALAQGPKGKGQYKDGHYYAEMDEFSNGWKYYASITVVNGYIVAADWDGIGEDTDKSKDQASADGDYGMVENGGAQSTWVEQASAAEAYLIETQDPTDIEYTSEEGHTDAISGATIHVKEFFDLAEQALADAK
ncbi:MAG: FMN-binding protein [Firmicutes bacterium]|nr:FMN-binding protein [Bacillota bacterium]